MTVIVLSVLAAASLAWLWWTIVPTRFRKTYTGVTVLVDGRRFVWCRFENCRLVTRGRPYSLLFCGDHGEVQRVPEEPLWQASPTPTPTVLNR